MHNFVPHIRQPAYIRCAITLQSVLLLACLVTPAPGAVRGRMEVAPNGRYLQYVDGTPFFLRRFMEVQAFHTLVPDQRIIVDGPTNGPAKIRAMRAEDRSRVVVYTRQWSSSPTSATWKLGLEKR